MEARRGTRRLTIALPLLPDIGSKSYTRLTPQTFTISWQGPTQIIQLLDAFRKAGLRAEMWLVVLLVDGDNTAQEQPWRS